MGVVDLCVDDAGRRFALKRLPLHGSAEELAIARRRLRREIEVLKRLDHHAIVPLLDVLEDGDDVVLVMPYLAGGTLADRIRREGPLSPGEVQLLGQRLLRGLAYAHRSGVVHRDIKPANVLFDDRGRPFLADFGVARTSEATLGLTRTDMVMGTPAFMAPEQARGEDVSPATDVFSMGATLRYAATGAGPWGNGEPSVILNRAAHGRAESLPRELPKAFRSWLQPLLARQPERRPSAAEVAGAPAGTMALKAGRRRSWRWLLVALTILVGAAVGMLLGVTRVLPSSSEGASPPTVLAAASSPRPPSTPTSETTTTTSCTPLPYWPCGAATPAAGTDGDACVEGRAEYDRVVTNGCEAVPDGRDGEVLDGLIEANLVPGDDVDSFTFTLGDSFNLRCNGRATITLVAPRGIAQRLDVLRDGDVVDTTTSADREPSTIELREQNCFGDDGGTFVAVVSSVGEDRSPDYYRLEVAGSL